MYFFLPGDKSFRHVLFTSHDIAGWFIMEHISSCKFACQSISRHPFFADIIIQLSLIYTIILYVVAGIYHGYSIPVLSESVVSFGYPGNCGVIHDHPLYVHCSGIIGWRAHSCHICTYYVFISLIAVCCNFLITSHHHLSFSHC